MLDVITNVITNILSAIYQEFGAALLFSAMALIIFLNYKEKGLKSILVDLVIGLKLSSNRSLFYLLFYSGMILFRTVLCRPAYYFPLADVFGGWKIVGDDGAILTDGIENLLLFIPFTYLYLKHSKPISSVGCTIKKAVLSALMLSIGIELTQLFLRTGTFQFADIVLNSLGGFVGACFFIVFNRR